MLFLEVQPQLPCYPSHVNILNHFNVLDASHRAALKEINNHASIHYTKRYSQPWCMRNVCGKFWCLNCAITVMFMQTIACELITDNMQRRHHNAFWSIPNLVLVLCEQYVPRHVKNVCSWTNTSLKQKSLNVSVVCIRNSQHCFSHIFVFKNYTKWIYKFKNSQLSPKHNWVFFLTKPILVDLEKGWQIIENNLLNSTHFIENSLYTKRGSRPANQKLAQNK